jgi:hypothetical protein
LLGFSCEGRWVLHMYQGRTGQHDPACLKLLLSLCQQGGGGGGGGVIRARGVLQDMTGAATGYLAASQAYALDTAVWAVGLYLQCSNWN